MTLDDGEQRLVNGQERRLVDRRGQVVERHGLERSEGQGHVMRVGQEAFALAQQ